MTQALTHPVFDAAEFDQALSSTGSALSLFRSTLKSGKQALYQRLDSGEPVENLVYDYASLVDQLLQRAWQRVFKHTRDAALIAVGGYGRGELHPGSDIDLLLLFEEGTIDLHKEDIESFLTFLWDIGMEVGQSVRTISDCVREATQDITVATNLMEARLLEGSMDLFLNMTRETGPDRIWPSNLFFEAKWKEQTDRHRRYDDTAYKLEPNIKEGPGGLRDIQMVGWVAKRHFNAHTLHDLVQHGFLTEQEYDSLIQGQRFLWKIRFVLHCLTKRREDRLLFDYQRTLAVKLGYTDSPNILGVEQFMQDYYRTIMELSRLNEMLLQLFQEVILYTQDSDIPSPINKRFQSIKGFLEVTEPSIFKRYPFALLEMFLVLQQHPELKGVRASTIRLVRNHRHLIDDKFRNDVRSRSLFMEIFRQPTGLTHALRRMNRYGILAAYLPAFARITGRMQYDLFHVYTVDEHTMFLVRNLRRFTVPEFAHEFPLCSKIIVTIPKPELLYLGGLFHDIAKGRGGDHSELGAEEAIQFCLKHGLSQYDANLVGWLVRNHLIMSMTAQRKDISDPDIIQEFSSRVGDLVHLDYLYLLTVADIRATNPELWNGWKDALLKELYQTTKAALRLGAGQQIDQDVLIRETQEEARKLLKKAKMKKRSIDSVWSQFDDEYFLRYSPEEIAWHTRAIADHANRNEPLVLVRHEESRGSTAIFIYGPAAADHLFAITTAVLEQIGLNIVDARIIPSTQNFSLDTYLVLEENGSTIDQPQRLKEIRDSLVHRLTHDATEEQIRVQRRLPRQHKHFDVNTTINFSNNPQNDRTVLEVVTADRPGLLSRIGKAFRLCGIRLHNARITTIGARIEDIFYITDLQNEPLTGEADRETLRNTIIELLKT